ncbi:MAG: transglutaminase domain-containing protein [Candidatus Omnitrophica bacterium]|nr:transglutaminase domain-containing protein [Candidatus Omnitrophota bacterium]
MSRRRLLVIGLAVLVLPTAVYGVLQLPAATKQGVNFQVSTHTLPLYAKLLAFLHRDQQYRLAARDITQGLRTDRERAAAVLAWVHDHVRQTPEGWPVIDDHILHIMIRGHGLADQRADVFATLSAYAGVPAFWRVFMFPDGGRLVVPFVRLDGRWVIVDAAHDAMLTDARGEPVAVGDPGMREALTAALGPHGAAAARHLAERGLMVPRPLRAELQMPWPRVAHEARRRFGWGPAHDLAAPPVVQME